MIRYNAELRELSGANKTIRLSKHLGNVLKLFISRPNRLVSIDALASYLYDHLPEPGSDISLRVAIHRLRRKLLEVGARVEIETVRGDGWVMKPV